MRAFGFAGLAAILFSLPPVVLHLFAREANPFLFSGVVFLSVSVSMLVYVKFTAEDCFSEIAEMASDSGSKRLGVWQVMGFVFPADASCRFPRLAHLRAFCALDPLSRHHGQAHHPLPTSECLRRFIRRPFLWYTVSKLDYAFFALAVGQMNATAATILYELWPIALVVILAKYMTSPNESASRTIDGRAKALMFAAFAGVAVVVFSQNAEGWDGLLSFGLLLGVLFGVISAVLAAISPAAGLQLGDLAQYRYGTFRAAEEIKAGSRPALAAIPNQDDRSERQQVWFMSLGLAIASLLALPLNLLLAGAYEIITEGERSSGVQWMLPTALLGMVCLGIGALALCHANLSSHDLGVNAMFFATPVLAVVWLVLAGVELRNPILLTVGALVVFGANALIGADTQKRLSIK